MRVKILQRIEDADNELVIKDGKKGFRHWVTKFYPGDVCELDAPRAEKLIGYGYAVETDEPVTREIA